MMFINIFNYQKIKQYILGKEMGITYLEIFSVVEPDPQKEHFLISTYNFLKLFF
jgi:hypothetical protein